MEVKLHINNLITLLLLYIAIKLESGIGLLLCIVEWLVSVFAIVFATAANDCEVAANEKAQYTTTDIDAINKTTKIVED